MDTGTHIVMGIGLGGLAMIDPSIAADPVTAQAVIAGTLIGSHAPDFDTVLKLKNNAVYIRNHRGITHSLPALVIWPLLLAGAIHLFVPGADGNKVLLWTAIAVILHVFVDIFNAYGTQALYPVSKKWVALGVISIFDPFIFFIHLLGIMLWYGGIDPGRTFLSIYVILVFYYIWRIIARKRADAFIRRKIPEAIEIIASPAIRYGQYHLAIKTPKQFIVAGLQGKELTVWDVFDRLPVPKNKMIAAANKDKNIAAFLSFSPVYRWEIEKNEYGHEIRYIDLRYRSKEHYPFVALAQLDDDLNVMTSYTGWVYSEDRLRKKLDYSPFDIVKNE
ncbi:metal-dependent hydrolase [Fictibacillus iocasae]|uniref:Metal-dependent hydrolase n=1 Tax=Fictibacillus iocasae TaxID=2715437 RepID=A0ABW2NT21_9BACL